MSGPTLRDQQHFWAVRFKAEWREIKEQLLGDAEISGGRRDLSSSPLKEPVLRRKTLKKHGDDLMIRDGMLTMECLRQDQVELVESKFFTFFMLGLLGSSQAQQGSGHTEELQPDGCESAGGEAGLSGMVVD